MLFSSGIVIRLHRVISLSPSYISVSITSVVIRLFLFNTHFFLQIKPDAHIVNALNRVEIGIRRCFLFVRDQCFPDALVLVTLMSQRKIKLVVTFARSSHAIDECSFFLLSVSAIVSSSSSIIAYRYMCWLRFMCFRLKNSRSSFQSNLLIRNK